MISPHDALAEAAKILADAHVRSDISEAGLALPYLDQARAELTDARAALRSTMIQLAQERASLETERDDALAALAALRAGGGDSELAELASARAQLEQRDEALGVAGDDFLRIKDKIEQGDYGIAASIAYDSWYRTAVAAPGLPVPAARTPEGDELQVAPSSGLDLELPPAREAVSAECDGSSDCRAVRHLHGCFADVGDCDHPDEHAAVSADTGQAEATWIYEAVSADTPEQDSGTPQSGSVVQHDSLKGEVHDG